MTKLSGRNSQSLVLGSLGLNINWVNVLFLDENLFHMAPSNYGALREDDDAIPFLLHYNKFDCT